MSLESARQLALDGLSFGEKGVKAFARRMLEELGMPVEAPTKSHALSPAERMRRHREKRRAENVTNGVTAVTSVTNGAVTSDVTRAFSLSLSSPLDHKIHGERERERSPRARVTNGVTNETNRVTAVTNGEADRDALPEDFAFPADWKRDAEELGIERPLEVFAKFKSVSVEKEWRFTPPAWKAKWKWFCIGDLEYQRKHPGVAKAPVQGAGKPRLWTVGRPEAK